MPRVIAALQADMARHADQAGIVHTVSHALAGKICDGLKSGRTIQLPVGSERDAVIEDFLAGKSGSNRVLVGPGLHEGIDGMGDAARWQAIAKAPIPYLGDPMVKAILERNPAMGRKWMNWKAAQAFVQACGRVTRSAEDTGVTYVYDSCCNDILGGPMCPRYLREAIRL